MEKQQAPGAKASLILGICSIVTACCCYGIPGIILGIIGLNKAKKARTEFANNPDVYSGYGNAETGKITSIIGIVLGALIIIYTTFLVSSGEWSAQMEEFRTIMEDME